MAPKTDFPPVRACLFDLDGLLLNTEDIYSLCHNTVLASYGGPPMTWEIKSQSLGRVAAQANALILKGSGLAHVDPAEYSGALAKVQKEQFPLCAPLPGVEKLLDDLKSTEKTDRRVHIALATSSRTSSYDLKVGRWKELMSVFEGRKVLGDDKRIGRGKPSPDIYLLALTLINESLAAGEREVKPEECLVFEDGLPGVEAGRRAGLRVVWVPHPSLAELYKGKEKGVLAGRGEGSTIDVHELGEIDDGWAEQLKTLEIFPYKKYGISIPN